MVVELLAHRGLWKHATEKNGLAALERALASGFGLETDLRDRGGEIVISHDAPGTTTTELPSLAQLCQLYVNMAATSCLALNIKADGLAQQVRATLDRLGIENYFVFDMSVPDMLSYVSQSMPYFSRQSEIEDSPVLYDDCSGIWLDAFHSCWYSEQLIEEHLAHGKAVCLVSPELHGRETQELWPMLRRLAIQRNQPGRLLLCTDFPEEFERSRACHE